MNLDRKMYEIYDGVKIYTGLTYMEDKTYNQSIKQLEEYNNNIFTELCPSILAVQGLISNISINQEDFIKKAFKPSHPIISICNNYGEIYSEKYEELHDIKSNIEYKDHSIEIKDEQGNHTGWKKLQGCGKYMNSQVTFHLIYEEKDYKIRVFQNGVIHIPGIIDPTMRSLTKACKFVIDYLRELLNNNDINLIEIRAVMRNYKCKLINQELIVDLHTLYDIIQEEEKKHSDINKYISYLYDDLPKSIKQKALKYVGKVNIMNIAEVAINNQKGCYLSVKINKPVSTRKTDNKCTINMFNSGKLNFNGCNSELEAKELYLWVQNLYFKNSSRILININEIKNEYDKETVEFYENNPENFLYYI